MKVKNILKKFGIILSSSLLLASATISPIAYANETHQAIAVQQQVITAEEEYLSLELELYQDFIIEQLINDIGEELPEISQITNSSIDDYQNQAAWGLLASLFARYGAVWVRNHLPRIIYARLAPYIGRYISQQYFIRFMGIAFSNMMGWNIQGTIYSLLINLGVPHAFANPASHIMYWALLAL